MLKIEPLAALQDNYIWILYQEQGDSVWVVDPGDAAPVQQWMQQQERHLAGIILTHHHWDHVNGIADLLAACETPSSVPVYGPALARYQATTHPLKEGDSLTIYDREFSVFELPGHTLNHIAYFGFLGTSEEPHSATLICGDTLFSCGCGRLFEGTPAQMHHSLQKLARLPAETAVCCTHEYTLANIRFALAVEPENQRLEEYQQQCLARREQGLPTLPSSLGLELAVNPFLRITEPDVRESLRSRHKDQLTTDEEYFAVLRQWKDNFAS